MFLDAGDGYRPPSLPRDVAGRDIIHAHEQRFRPIALHPTTRDGEEPSGETQRNHSDCYLKPGIHAMKRRDAATPLS